MSPLNLVVVCVVLGACGPATVVPTALEKKSAAPAAVEKKSAEPQESSSISKEVPFDPSRCHHSCCSDKVRELQQQQAASSGDPTIEYECCFCEAQPDAPNETEAEPKSNILQQRPVCSALCCDPDDRRQCCPCE